MQAGRPRLLLVDHMAGSTSGSTATSSLSARRSCSSSGHAGKEIKKERRRCMDFREWECRAPHTTCVGTILGGEIPARHNRRLHLLHIHTVSYLPGSTVFAMLPKWATSSSLSSLAAGCASWRRWCWCWRSLRSPPLTSPCATASCESTVMYPHRMHTHPTTCTYWALLLISLM